MVVCRDLPHVRGIRWVPHHNRIFSRVHDDEKGWRRADTQESSRNNEYTLESESDSHRKPRAKVIANAYLKASATPHVVNATNVHDPCTEADVAKCGQRCRRRSTEAGVAQNLIGAIGQLRKNFVILSTLSP